jgi:hypothetical protein
MLIAEAIRDLCDQERLFRVEPLDFRGEEKRTIYVSRDIHDFLDARSGDSAVGAVRMRLQRLFDRFVLGQEISVSFGRRTKPTHIKRLSPKNAEVWEFKLSGRRAKHQARVFGRFAETDVFLALTGPIDRANCDYSGEIARCQAEWSVLFPQHSPVYGSKINDYISAKAILL